MAAWDLLFVESAVAVFWLPLQPARRSEPPALQCSSSGPPVLIGKAGGEQGQTGAWGSSGGTGLMAPLPGCVFFKVTFHIALGHHAMIGTGRNSAKSEF